MNVRMDEKGLRFRITPEELSTLLRGDILEHRITAGDGGLTYGITPSFGREGALSIGHDGFRLCIPVCMLEELRDIGLSREGLRIQQEGLEISLQVDIKAQLGRAA